MLRSEVRILHCPPQLKTLNDRGIEQLAARQAHNLEVAGSNPAPATKTGPIGSNTGPR